MTPDKIITLNGIEVKQKIIPDGTRWADSIKAANAGFSANALYKAQTKISKHNTVTIHNTEDLDNIQDDAERYVLATQNQNMGSVRPHLYVDESSVWQLLDFDEVAWCNARGTTNTGAIDDIAIECVMGESDKSDKIAEDKTAKLAAFLLHKYGLDITALRTHTYWINYNLGIRGSVDYMNTYISPKALKKCPFYILPHWTTFKATVEKYLNLLNNPVVYRVRKSAENIESQIGAYTNLSAAKNLADYNRGYKVFADNGTKVYQPTVYLEKNVTIKGFCPIKFEPKQKAKTIARFPKGKEITVFLGTSVPAENGTFWVKFTSPECNAFADKCAWIPLKYIEKV